MALSFGISVALTPSSVPGSPSPNPVSTGSGCQGDKTPTIETKAPVKRRSARVAGDKVKGSAKISKAESRAQEEKSSSFGESSAESPRKRLRNRARSGSSPLSDPPPAPPTLDSPRTVAHPYRYSH